MYRYALPAGAFIAAFLILIAAYWQWRARQVPVLSLIAWLFVTNIIYGANSLVWSNDVQDKAPVWCDISTKLIIGAAAGIPACNLCISRHLAMAGRGRAAGLDGRDRRRIFLFDIGFCWVVPMIFMALNYTVQGHRYDITEHVGCSQNIYVSIPGVLIDWVPPVLLSVGSSVYAGIALYRFVRSSALSNNLQASGSSMSINQYKRLMAMSVTLMVLGTAMTSFVLWVAARNGLRPWVGWKRVHSHWSRVLFYRWALMDPESRWTLLLSWWAVPVSTVVSFIFLGFGEDAVQGYRKVGAAMVRMIPSKVLSKRIGESRKGTVLAPMRPSCGLSLDGPPTQLPADSSAANRTFQELPRIQPFRSLYSMIGLPRSKTKSWSSGGPGGWRWSEESGKSGSAPLQSGGVEGGLRDHASGAETAELRGVHVGGSIQGSTEGQEPHSQV